MIGMYFIPYTNSSYGFKGYLKVSGSLQGAQMAYAQRAWFSQGHPASTTRACTMYPCIKAQDTCKIKDVTRLSARLGRPSIATDPAEDHSIDGRINIVAMQT